MNCLLKMSRFPVRLDSQKSSTAPCGPSTGNGWSSRAAVSGDLPCGTEAVGAAQEALQRDHPGGPGAGQLAPREQPDRALGVQHRARSRRAGSGDRDRRRLARPTWTGAGSGMRWDEMLAAASGPLRQNTQTASFPSARTHGVWLAAPAEITCSSSCSTAGRIRTRRMAVLPPPSSERNATHTSPVASTVAVRSPVLPESAAAVLGDSCCGAASTNVRSVVRQRRNCRPGAGGAGDVLPEEHHQLAGEYRERLPVGARTHRHRDLGGGAELARRAAVRVTMSCPPVSYTSTSSPPGSSTEHGNHARPAPG